MRGGMGLLLMCGLLASAILSAVCESAHAYTGGPIRAYIAGLEPEAARVFYRLAVNDEAFRRLQVWFFDLDGKQPMCPIRLPALDSKGRESGAQSAWSFFSSRLIPLRLSREFDISLSVNADSAGVDTAWGGAVRYEAEVIVRKAPWEWILDLAMFGNALIRVQCLYEVPERPEALIILTHNGRAYGCEEIDLPVLIAPTQADLSGPEVPRWRAQGERAYINRHLAGNLVTKRDEYQRVTWYMTKRSTSLQQKDDARFDVEVYFGKRDDGSKDLRFLTRYTDADSLPHQGKWIRYGRVRLTDDVGNELDVSTRPPDKQADSSVYGIMEWCDQTLTEDALLPFANSGGIRARFEGETTYEFDLNGNQVLAIREIIERYKTE